MKEVIANKAVALAVTVKMQVPTVRATVIIAASTPVASLQDTTKLPSLA